MLIQLLRPQAPFPCHGASLIELSQLPCLPGPPLGFKYPYSTQWHRWILALPNACSLATSNKRISAILVSKGPLIVCNQFSQAGLNNLCLLTTCAKPLPPQLAFIGLFKILTDCTGKAQTPEQATLHFIYCAKPGTCTFSLCIIIFKWVSYTQLPVKSVKSWHICGMQKGSFSLRTSPSGAWQCWTRTTRT